MFKKFISVITIFAVLLAFTPVVAADTAPATPTIESILENYHEKAFTARASGDAVATAAYSSRSGDTTLTLEQETVNELTAAGYEAYNVTSDNYDAMADSLQTDLGKLGLDPDGSYIVVISGEDRVFDNDNPESRNTGRSLGDPNMDLIGGGLSEGFTFNYYGVPYTMRYITITSADTSYMQVHSNYELQPSFWLQEASVDIFSTFLFGAADSIVNKHPFGTIISLILDIAQDDNYTELEPGTLTLHAASLWTCDVIQVWDASSSKWENAQASAHAISKAYCSGFLYDPGENDLVRYDGVLYSIRNNSPKYSNYSQRKVDAVLAYNNSRISYDYTGDIDFYLGNAQGEVLFTSGSNPLFTHQEGWMVG